MKLSERREAVKLRLQGKSLKEISEGLRVAKSSVSLWVRDVALSQSAKRRLLQKITAGQFVSAEKKKAQVRALEQKYLDEAKQELAHAPNYKKIICAVMYWCEGTKNPKSGLTFTNSDPLLVRKFLELLRVSFPIDEKRFHPCIHIHEYHSPERQLDFWSKITKINKRQFIKPYRKPNSGKRIHPSYQGCVSMRYHNSNLARRMLAIAKAFLGA
jgi:hypothetical protein